jgi:hypothetical protein
MQHPEVLSEAYPEPLAAMTEEHQEAARLSAAGVLPLHSQAVSPAAESSHWAQEFGRVLAVIRVDAMASHRERPAGPEVHFRDVAAAADLAVREQAKVWPLPAVAAQPLEARAAVVGQPSAVPVAAVARPSEPEAAVEEEQSSEVRVAVAAQPLEARAAVVGQPSAVPVTRRWRRMCRRRRRRCGTSGWRRRRRCLRRSSGRRCCLRWHLWWHLRRFLFWRGGLRDNERRCLRVGRK